MWVVFHARLDFCVIFCSLYVLCWSFSKICMRTFAGSGILGTLHTYLDIFENGEFFPPFSKKIRLQKWRIRIVFGRPHENAKQRKYDSIPHRACLMLVLNDVLHHRIWKPPFSSVHTKTSGQRIQNDAFLVTVFTDYCVNGRPSPRKNPPFPNKDG